MGLGATLPNHIPACRSEFKGLGVLRIERKSCHMQLQGKHSNDCDLKQQTHLIKKKLFLTAKLHQAFTK